MRYPVEETAARHERILQEASRLFRVHGLQSVTVPEIMRAADLTHGPFYNHFSSKEELVTESVDRAMNEMLDRIQNIPHSKTARSRFLAEYLSQRHRDSPGDGCAMAALASDVGHQQSARGAFTLKFKEIISAVAKKFGVQDEISARHDAIRTVATIVGAMILARTVDDLDLSDEILSVTKTGL